jgi:hypothetical protein
MKNNEKELKEKMQALDQGFLALVTLEEAEAEAEAEPEEPFDPTSTDAMVVVQDSNHGIEVTPLGMKRPLKAEELDDDVLERINSRDSVVKKPVLKRLAEVMGGEAQQQKVLLITYKGLFEHGLLNKSVVYIDEPLFRSNRARKIQTMIEATSIEQLASRYPEIAVVKKHIQACMSKFAKDKMIMLVRTEADAFEILGFYLEGGVLLDADEPIPEGFVDAPMSLSESEASASSSSSSAAAADSNKKHGNNKKKQQQGKNRNRK